MNRLRIDRYLYFFILSWSQIAFSQGLCNNSSFEKGNFDLSAKEICVYESIDVINQSNSKKVKYIFDYQFESLDEINRLAIPDEKYKYLDNGQSKIYTILQVGEVNGKTSIACQNLIVRANNVPEHSFSVCGSMVEFNIPNHPLNNFDSYTLELGSQSVLINKSELPYSKRFPVALPGGYRLLGNYSDTSKNCQSSNSFKTIPATSIITSLPFHPNINKLELLDLSTLKLEYSGPYSGDTSLHATLYRFEKTLSPTSAVAIQRNIIPGVQVFSIPDSTKSYCYFVKKKNFCGNEVEESAEICTHPLFSAEFNPYQYQNELVWDKYPTLFKGIFVPPSINSLLSGISYSTSQRIKFIEDNSNVKGISVPKQASVYNHKLIDCKKKYCYSTEQTIAGTLNYIQYYGVSVSNKKCIDQSKVLAPAPSKFYVTTEKNKNQIYFIDDGIWPLMKEKWFLYKLEEDNYLKIDSVLNGSMIFTDSSEVVRSESYKIGFLDQCNSLSKLSNNASSVYLDFSLPNELMWTSASPFSDQDVLKYEIFHVDDSTGIVSKLDEVSSNKYEADLNPYSGKASFIINAISSNVNQPSSSSNIISLSIPSSIYIPTAFSPDGDRINDILIVKGKVNINDKFVVNIYNRFGQQIKQITEISESWDGRFKGKNLESGVYSYQLKIISENGTSTYKTGVIFILR